MAINPEISRSYYSLFMSTIITVCIATKGASATLQSVGDHSDCWASFLSTVFYSPALSPHKNKSMKWKTRKTTNKNRNPNDTQKAGKPPHFRIISNNNNQKKKKKTWSKQDRVSICAVMSGRLWQRRIKQYNRSVTHCGMVDWQDDGLDSHMHFPNHFFIL